MFSVLTYLPLLILVWIPLSLYYWILYRNSYWKRNGIPFIPATPFIGNMKNLLLFRKCVAEQFSDFYYDKNVQDQPFVGIHIFLKPAIIVREPELIKRILVKDFTSFANRYLK